MKILKSRSGFTLVEMIVVIAIIAVLAAVIIPATVSYVDDARLSNDRTAAAQLNRTIEFAHVQNPDLHEEELDGYQIKQIIEEATGETFNWTPQSRNSGFFFNSYTRTIVVSKYSEADKVLDNMTLSQPFSISLNRGIHLMAPGNNGPGSTPQELFGEGLFLLTTEGSGLAEVVREISNLANSEDLMTDYNQLVNRVNPTLAFLRAPVQQALLNDILDEFHPNQTLFVNNTQWVYKTEVVDEPSTEKEFSNIVFAPGIHTIPAYPAAYWKPSVVSLIYVPNSVRFIEAGAFSRFTEDLSIQFSRMTLIDIHEDAFDEAHNELLVGYSNIRFIS